MFSKLYTATLVMINENAIPIWSARRSVRFMWFLSKNCEHLWSRPQWTVLPDTATVFFKKLQAVMFWETKGEIVTKNPVILPFKKLLRSRNNAVEMMWIPWLIFDNASTNLETHVRNFAEFSMLQRASPKPCVFITVNYHQRYPLSLCLTYVTH